MYANEKLTSQLSIIWNNNKVNLFLDNNDKFYINIQYNFSNVE